MNYDAILLEKKDGVATVTLNQPKSMNALTGAVLDELSKAVREISEDDEIKVVIFTGTGKAFCAGGDIRRFSDGFDHVSGLDYVESIHKVIKEILAIKVPTIAAVNGAAVGAGMSLMLLCDIAYMADSAKTGCAFINMGLCPDCALAYNLVRTVGIKRAKELVFNGRNISAAEALEYGLVSKVFPADELMDNVNELALTLAKGPSFALRLAKRMMDASLDTDLNTFLSMEAVMQTACLVSEDSKEAVSAFMSKRVPEFRGR